jgi:hypothetical protein
VPTVVYRVSLSVGVVGSWLWCVGCWVLDVHWRCRLSFTFSISGAQLCYTVMAMFCHFDLATEQDTQSGNGHLLANIPSWMVKSAQPGEGWDFTLSTITSKVVVYAPAERADTLLLFAL